MSNGYIYRDNTVLRSLHCGSVRVGSKLTKSWSGGDDPNKVVPQNYTMTLNESLDNEFQFVRLDGVVWQSCTAAALVGEPNWSFSWNSNSDLALISKLRTKIVGSEFNLGIFLGEGKEALSMIADTASRIYLSYKAIRRGNLSLATDLALGRKSIAYGREVTALTNERVTRNIEFARRMERSDRLYAKTSANKHLEVVYGWIPLLEDVKGAAEALAHQLSTPKTFKVRVAKREIGRVTGSPLMSHSGHAFTSSSIIAYLSEDPNLPKLHGLSDPAQVLWELTPYSFVADWFYPIGSYLEARGVASALKGTFVTSKKSMADVVFWPNPAFYKALRGNYRSRRKRIHFDRKVGAILNVPTPDLVPFSEAIGWKRATNAVALITQRL